MTLAELKPEAFLPADPATAEALLAAVGPMASAAAGRAPENTRSALTAP